MAKPMKVEVVYGDVKTQRLLSLEISSDSTAVDAIKNSKILDDYPEIDLNTVQIGIFGKKVSLSHQLEENDRVEIYRPLLIDPKEARRLRAEKIK